MFKAEVKSDYNEDICILIKVENHSYNYICEAGEAKKLGVKDCQNTNAIFLSHTHIDHFSNFDTILRHQIGIQRKIVICGPSGIIDQVQNRIKSYCWNLIEADSISYEVREIINPTTYKSVMLTPPLWEKEAERIVDMHAVFEEKDFVVECEILDHKTDSIAYLFKANDKTKIILPKEFKGGKWVAELKNAYDKKDNNRLIKIGDTEYKSENLFHLIKEEKGKSLGVIMDHAVSEGNHEKIKAKFQNCDEVYIECFYKDEDKEFANKNYHSYASKSGEVVRQANINKAIPVHFSRKYNEEEIDILINQFETSKNI